MLVQQFLVLESYYRCVNRHAYWLGAFYHFGITRNDWAVIAVLLVVFLLFEHHKGHEYAVYSPPGQIFDVTMHEFCGKADVVAHYTACRVFIMRIVRRFRQFHFHSAACKQCVPERIFLIHVQAARDSYPQRGVSYLRRAVEKQLQLIFVNICPGLCLFAAVREYLFATVAGIVTLFAIEKVLRYLATVFAPFAMQQPRSKVRTPEHFVYRNACFRLVSDSVECAPHCSHEFGAITAIYVSARQFFERTHYGVVAHCSALYYYMAAELGRVFKLQHLVKAVFYNGIRKPCRNIGHSGALAQHLFHFRVHEHGATRSKVAGMC